MIQVQREKEAEESRGKRNLVSGRKMGRNTAYFTIGCVWNGKI